MGLMWLAIVVAAIVVALGATVVVMQRSRAPRTPTPGPIAQRLREGSPASPTSPAKPDPAGTDPAQEA